MDDITKKMEFKIKCSVHDTLTCDLMTSNPESTKANVDKMKTELNTIKVRLENILCETDEKEQVIKVNLIIQL